MNLFKGKEELPPLPDPEPGWTPYNATRVKCLCGNLTFELSYMVVVKKTVNIGESLTLSVPVLTCKKCKQTRWAAAMGPQDLSPVMRIDPSWIKPVNKGDNDESVEFEGTEKQTGIPESESAGGGEGGGGEAKGIIVNEHGL